MQLSVSMTLYITELWIKKIFIYIRIKAAWKSVITVLEYIQTKLNLNELPINQIYVNFGRWHSQIRKDSLSGHAHINIVLTLAAIGSCET